MAVKNTPRVLRTLLYIAIAFQALGATVVSAETKINVYSSNSKILLGTVPSDSKWDVIERQKGWHLVRFGQPLVPAWVSSAYVRLDQKSATVRVNRLNARTRPSIQAPVLGTVSNGYSSEVLARSNGFIQIYAPNNLVFALKTQAKTKINQEASIVSNQTNSSGAWTLNDSTQQEASASVPSAVSTSPSVTPPAVINKDVEKPHRISPGDTISLLVFGEPELSAANVRVPQSGAVSFPLIGSTIVQGKTTEEIEQLIAVKLAGGYVKNPRLSITIDGYRPIFIRGAVALTGDFPFTEGLTVVKAISLAGGAKNSAKDNGVSILRDGTTVHEALSIDSLIEIRSGDIITVEEELGVGDESISYVYLHGEVKSPGEYKFRRGLTVEKAVVLAGGFTLRASKRKISLSRVVDGELEPEKLRKVKLYLPVQPGDIIDVGASWL